MTPREQARARLMADQWWTPTQIEDILDDIQRVLEALAEERDARLEKLTPAARDAWDEAYERAAARARDNDFEETDGRDWT